MPRIERVRILISESNGIFVNFGDDSLNFDTETVEMDIIQAIQATEGDCSEGMHTFNTYVYSTV